ncbi:hypothetical protein ACQJBY_066698 [Aegilops geniculata]
MSRIISVCRESNAMDLLRHAHLCSMTFLRIIIYKVGDHDVNQLQIQQNSSSPQDLVIDSMPEVRERRDLTGESVSRPNQQGTRTEHPHPTCSKRTHTSSIMVASKVVLKNSTYPNKRNAVYDTIQSTDPRTKAGGIELAAEFALVRIDQPILDNEELVREVPDCKTIGEAFTSGYLIAWPLAFIQRDGSLSCSRILVSRSK